MGFHKIRLNYLKLKNLLIVIMSLILVVGSGLFSPQKIYASGTTYFVAKNGSDNNPGTEAQPWLTINHAAQILNPGDTVYVKSGIYNEIVNPITNGTPGNPITFAAYPGQSPIIDATGLTTYPCGIFGIYQLSYINLDGFEMRNSADWAGIYIYSGTCSNISLKNLTIHDCASSGILIVSDWDSNPSNKINNIIIDGCEIYNTNIGGGQEGISLMAVNNFEIKNCSVHDIQGHQNYSNDKEGIDCKVGCTNGAIHNNEVYHAEVGLYLDANSIAETNISLYNNKIHDCYSNGIALGSEGTHQPLTGINVYNNLIYDNRRGFSVFNYAFNKTFNLINNSLYHNGIDSEIALFDSSQYQQNCTIRNNIIVGQYNSTYLLQYAGAPTGVTINNNLFFNLAGYQTENIYGTNYILNKDPLFVNAANLDFHLQSNSPAINAGSSILAPTTDYAGNSRPQGAGYDIGAYEYVNPAPALDHITLTPASPSVAAGATQTYSAQGYDTGNNAISGLTYTWSLTNAAAGSINSSGVFTAGTIGSYANVILATSGGKTGTASVTVTAGALDHITLTPPSTSVAIFGNVSFTARGYDVGNNPINGLSYSWSVTNAAAGSINSNGVFTAGTTAGSYANIIQATSGGKTATASVTVTAITVDHITITPSNPSVPIGGTKSFAAQAYDSSNNAISGVSYTWSVSSSFAGSINSSGVFTAGIAAGTYPNVIVVTAGGKIMTTSVTITQQSTTAWDINQDGHVNVLEMILVGQYTGQTGTPGWIPEDVNHDGIISVLDSILIGQHWTG